ncbi:hypothetical protein PENTCL1PPCAC_2990, partial [Pristionchus entomophagus]
SMSPPSLLPLFLLLLVSSLAVNGKKPTVHGQGCEWVGMAPFCRGSCPEKYYRPEIYVMSKSTMANYGGTCLTGEKVMCCPDRYNG